jgi:hypothetical protein
LSHPLGAFPPPRVVDTCKMYPCTLVYLIKYFMIYAWYVRFPSWFTLIYGERTEQGPFQWFLLGRHKKPMFEFFFSIGDLTNIKLTSIFCHIIFSGFIRRWGWPEEARGPEEAHGAGHPRSVSWDPSGPRWPYSPWFGWHPVSFSLKKIIYMMTYVHSRKNGSQTKTWNREVLRILRRETPPDWTVVAPQTPSTSTSPPPWWRESIPSRDLGFVEASCMTSPFVRQ